MNELIRPFFCGTQFADWVERNCMRCRKYNPDEISGECEIDEALSYAFMDDGTISPTIARRMGYYGNELALTWDCPERRLRP